MNIDDFNLSTNKSNLNESSDGLLESFLKELKKIITNNSSPSISNKLLEDSIYVVRDINDERLSLVNIENGEDFDIYIATSKIQISELNANGISNNIYEMSEDELYDLNLGSNIIIKNGICMPYYGEIKINNPKAAAKLEDMYFCLEQEKDAQYLVSDISDEKIYLTNTEEGGYFSIPRRKYPDFKIGDLLKNINGKYTII